MPSLIAGIVTLGLALLGLLPGHATSSSRRHEASARIPAAAQVLEANALRGRQLLWSKTVSDAERVHAVARALDALPVFPPGTYSCPAEVAPTHGPTALKLIFRSQDVSAPLAEAKQPLPGGFCSPMEVKIRGKEHPALEDAPRVLRKFGLLKSQHLQATGAAIKATAARRG